MGRYTAGRGQAPDHDAAPEGRAPKPAYERALDALTRRARSAQELRRWLADRGYAAHEVSEVIERLVSSGLLDDANYAAAFARVRMMDRKQSRRRVLAELARRGVTREVADAAVAAVAEDEGVDEESAVEQAAARKLRSLTGLDRLTAQRRLYGFLSRRGYDADVVRRVVARLLSR